MNGNSAQPGCQLTSKPTWWNTEEVFRHVGFFSFRGAGDRKAPDPPRHLLWEYHHAIPSLAQNRLHTLAGGMDGPLHPWPLHPRRPLQPGADVVVLLHWQL